LHRQGTTRAAAVSDGEGCRVGRRGMARQGTFSCPAGRLYLPVVWAACCRCMRTSPRGWGWSAFV
jgi:hypothetical protein